MSKVSQITTVWNVEEWLERTIQSFLAQTLQDSELILINDCSPDNSEAIIEKYTYNDRIKVITNPTNLGAGISRQLGLKQAQGEYTIFVDGDDWLEPDCLEKMYVAAKEHNADIVSCSVYQHNDYGLHPSKAKGDIWITIDKYNFINNKLINKKIWEQTPYSPLRFREDINTLFRCLEFGEGYYEMDYVGYHYNLRPSSLTSSKGVLCKSYIYTALAIIENIVFAERHFPNPSRLYRHYYNIRMVGRALRWAYRCRKGNEYEEEFTQVRQFLRKQRELWKHNLS